MVTEGLQDLKGIPFDELLLWAAIDIKSDASLEDTILKLQVFSRAEAQTRPSPLEIRARPSHFYDRRRDLIKLEFLTRNQEYQSFLKDLESLAEERPFRVEDKKKIVAEIGITYTSLLLTSKSLIGPAAAATPLFRSYLMEMVENGVKPGWHYYTMLRTLNASQNLDVIAALLQPLNLNTMMLFDYASSWFDKRYQDAIDASPFEVRWLESGAKSGDERTKEYFKHQIDQAEETIGGYGLGRQRFKKASINLVNTLLDETDNSVWRKFLLYKGSFGEVARHAGMFTPGPDHFDPEADITHARELVETAYAHNPSRAFDFINRYLHSWWNFPNHIHKDLDQLVKNGDWIIPRIATIFAEQKERSNPTPRTTYGEEEPLWDFWYNKIISGNLSPSEARFIPQQFFSVRSRLLAELKKHKPHAYEGTVNEQYANILTSRDMLKEPDLLIATVGVELEPTDEQINGLLNKGYSRKELLHRLQAINEMTAQTDMTMTPKLLEYLVAESDLQGAFSELGRLREETQNGKFNSNNELQRELEFGPYVKLQAKLSGSQSQSTSTNQREVYERFSQLELLPALQEDDVKLTRQESNEVDRAAYEAVGFVQFLRQLKEQTSRQIYVIGNSRYGQLFVVQPVEEFLDSNIRIRYDRVRSGGTQELTVPNIFPPEFVREMSRRMPHIVIVDGASPPDKEGKSRFSRATLGYANWFALFNDLRVNGYISKYRADSSFTEEHLAKLRESPNFISLRRELEGLVNEGETYRVVQWAPDLKSSVYYADIGVNASSLVFGSDKPLVVMANPIIYKGWEQGMPRSLQRGHPFYWDDPDKYARQKTNVGFGPFGVEARTEGRNLERLLGVVQEGINKGVRLYLRSL